MITLNLSSQQKLMLKMGVIAFIALLLLIPVEWVKSLITERKQLKEQANQEVSKTWGQHQTVTSPIIAIPFTEHKQIKGTLFISSKKANVTQKLTSEVRVVGIFESIVYNSECNFDIGFEIKDLPLKDQRNYELENAEILIGVTDISKISSEVIADFDGTSLKMQPSQKYGNQMPNCLSARLNSKFDKSDHVFKINYTVRGSNAVSMVCTGESNNIIISSNWPSPSFLKSKLPNTKEVNDKGFNANWNLNILNTTTPQHWTDAEYFLVRKEADIVVDLLQPTDHYSMNYRSAKYAILIITLCFLTFIAFEMFKKVKLHVVQYILIGLALAIFYLLLLALTEHIHFNKAYAISSCSVILLISTYISSYTKDLKLTSLFAICLLGLFSYIYVILQLEDYALLAGTIGLFIILSALMLLSRKIDWYKI